MKTQTTEIKEPGSSMTLADHLCFAEKAVTVIRALAETERSEDAMELRGRMLELCDTLKDVAYLITH